MFCPTQYERRWDVNIFDDARRVFWQETKKRWRPSELCSLQWYKSWPDPVQLVVRGLWEDREHPAAAEKFRTAYRWRKSDQQTVKNADI